MTSAINGVRPAARLRADTSAESIMTLLEAALRAGGIAALLSTLTLVSVAVPPSRRSPEYGPTGACRAGSQRFSTSATTRRCTC